MTNKYCTISRWQYSYDEETIEVFNGLGACHLSINDEIQAIKQGYAINHANLIGQLANGKTVEIKYTNILRPKCSVFVDGQLLSKEFLRPNSEE